ncbi:phosphate ABC transporter substrate-binding protein PstS [bacterium]|nr:phosphate ABC transporter substrate-binding protein PstS [bacterium]MBU1883109.1 phosphate ABC transporter substrate-binding protein PstS [bacterium]
MKKLALLAPLAALLVTTGSVSAADLKGSGASFPYSVYQSWIGAYHKATGIEIDYISKGSSAGIKDAEARTVDFAGTDAPLNPPKLAEDKLYQFPGVVGAITMSYNMPNTPKLSLSRAAISGIVLGKVAYWDDKVITDANKGVKLPHEKITFVHRADGSGTTFNFTYYLSKISDEWKTAYGAKKALNWPGDHHVGGKGNTGVAALIKQTPYSVGYVDYADATNNSLQMAVVENKEGNFITPTLKAFQAAAAKADLDPKKDFYAVIADPAGKDAYPIVAATFILMPKEAVAMDKKVTAFYDWSFKNGQALASELGYVPLPDALTDKIRKYWSEKGVN